jgi:phosphate transport system substrate-binding protein
MRQYENVEEEAQSAGNDSATPAIIRHIDAYQQVVDSVGSDRYAIGLAGAGYRNPRAKLVAIAVGDGGPFVMATPESVASRRYPLARPVRFYINSGPAIPADPRVVEFLRFVLSRQGQELVLREGDFLPLEGAEARAELARLPPAGGI